LDSYLNLITKDLSVPSAYKDINIKYKNVSKDTKFYKLLQKAVRLDLFPNASINLPLDKKITQDQVCTMVKSNFDLDLNCQK